ncbi:MAG: hypothetical protein ACYCUG_10485 [Acidimicrobiales bacterium]
MGGRGEGKAIGAVGSARQRPHLSTVAPIVSQARKARSRAADADYPPPWRATIGTDHLVVNVTADELARLRWAIRSLIEAAQRSGRSSRSPGAETVDVGRRLRPRVHSHAPTRPGGERPASGQPQ